ncbi:MAG: glycosyltransferase [Planctomycetota bacterium]
MPPIGGRGKAMRITWLLEVADQLWGGVKVALENANWQHRQGHRVTVVSRSGPPAWMQLACDFRRVQDFRSEHLPDADVLVATYWTTVSWARSAAPTKGAPVHFCQGYEGDGAENEALRDRIESAYRLSGVQRVTVSPHLTRLFQQRFGIAASQVPYTIDHAVHFPGPERQPGTPLRVGLVGPWQVAWKGLATGYAACQLAHQAGQQLVLVRATNTAPDPAELQQPFPIEWHRQLPPSAMGDFYRSLDLLIATSTGAEEGFFLPAVEAMACGVPTILTDVPCFRDHQALAGNEHYAMFVPPNDPAALAEAIVVGGAIQDVRTTLRREGLRLAAHYRPETHGQALLQVFEQAAATRRGHEPHALRLVDGARPAATAATPPGVSPLATIGAQLRRLANDLDQRGEAELAARALLAAHDLSPHDRELALTAALAQHTAGDPATALRLYDALAAAGADDAVLHQGRGEALHALGRMHDAAQAFRAALATGPRTADAYNRLGVVLFQAGDLAGARDSFERALDVEPGHDDAAANLKALPAA